MQKGKQASFDPKKDKKLSIFAAQKYPAWQDSYIDLVQKAFDEVSLNVNVKSITSQIDKKDLKRAMPFIQGIAKQLSSGVPKESVFERKLLFDELEVLRNMAPILPITKLKQVEIVSVEEGGKAGTVVWPKDQEGTRKDGLPPMAEGAVPGNPTFVFENI